MTGSDVESRSTEHAKPWRAAFEDVAVVFWWKRGSATACVVVTLGDDERSGVDNIAHSVSPHASRP